MRTEPNIQCPCGGSVGTHSEEKDQRGRVLAFTAECSSCGATKRMDKNMPPESLRPEEAELVPVCPDCDGEGTVESGPHCVGQRSKCDGFCGGCYEDDPCPTCRPDDLEDYYEPEPHYHGEI